MRELSGTEQRYKAVLAVINDGRTVTEVARDRDVMRQTLHEWLRRYEDEGIEGLPNRSQRPELGLEVIHQPRQPHNRFHDENDEDIHAGESLTRTPLVCEGAIHLPSAPGTNRGVLGVDTFHDGRPELSKLGKSSRGPLSAGAPTCLCGTGALPPHRDSVNFLNFR
jgi:transposase-like protein